MSAAFKDSVPGELETHITAICGHTGVQWLASLPETIGMIENKWGVKVDAPFPGIEFNFVAPATRSNGDPVAVKISPPYKRIEIFQEAKYLRARNGSGAIRVLDEDRELKAILLERAIPGEALFKRFEKNPAACVKPAVELLLNILRPPPDDLADVELLDNWFVRFQRYLDTAFPADMAAKASEIYFRLSKQAERIFYIHGDFHPGNIVTSDRSEYLAIDPKGLVGHIGYDIAVFLNNLLWWQREKEDIAGMLQTAIECFSDAFDISEKEIREWAFAYMVIGAWWNFDEMPEHYDDTVAMSDLWCV